MAKGFYVPGSKSGSYVASQQDEQGTYAYDRDMISAGIQKQAALQDLSQDYEQTISNAYASYLANQRTIDTSAMGEGYKEAYRTKQLEALNEQLAQSNQTAQTARTQIEQQAGTITSNIQKQYEQEVKYLDKVAQSMDDYLQYVNSLSDVGGANYWGLSSEELANMTSEQYYDQLLSMDPKAYTDEEGKAGMNYEQWLNANLKESDADWKQWLYGGGLESYRKMMRPTDQELVARAQQEQETTAKVKAEEEARLKAEADAKQRQAEEIDAKLKDLSKTNTGYVGADATVTGTSWGMPTGYKYGNNTYKIVGAAQANSKLGLALDDLFAKDFKSGKLKVGSLVKYQGQLYAISAKSSSPGTHLAYDKLELK